VLAASLQAQGLAPMRRHAFASPRRLAVHVAGVLPRPPTAPCSKS
jgi:glycyl-tRNA synthetase beta subunit